MVKPEKARRVEEMLIQAATSGALGGKVTETQFIQMLEQVGQFVAQNRAHFMEYFFLVDCRLFQEKYMYDPMVLGVGC